MRHPGAPDGSGSDFIGQEEATVAEGRLY